MISKENKEQVFNMTVLSNNCALKDFEAEHGFSVLLDNGNQKVLFDTGQGEAFRNNIKKLNIELTSINTLVLSHGHYDHCGNISFVLGQSNNINTYFHPAATTVRYSIHKDRDPNVRSIGISSDNKNLLSNYHSHSNKSQKIGNDIFITGEIPRLTNEDTGGPFFFDKAGLKSDGILDDQSIWIENKEGLIIITGCCHSGLQNSVEYIKKLSGIDKVKTIIGGFHLSKASSKRIDETIRYINSLNVENILPGHCTGDNVINRFREELNCNVIELLAGDKIIL